MFACLLHGGRLLRGVRQDVRGPWVKERRLPPLVSGFSLTPEEVPIIGFVLARSEVKQQKK